MKIAIFDCVLAHFALLGFFMSTSSRSVLESSSMPLLTTVQCLNFLDVDVLHVRLCSVLATMQCVVGWRF
jgi:hypothetical protein